MKHLEQDSSRPAALPREPEPQRAQPRSPQTRERRKPYIGAVLLGVALISAGGWGLTALFGARHTDRVTEQDRTQRAAAFAQMKPLALSRVSDSDWNAALDSMKLSPGDRAMLLKDVVVPGAAELAAPAAAAAATPQPAPQSIAATPMRRAAPSPAAAAPKKAVLVWLTLWDTHAQDGDIVLVQSGGYQQEVTLLNKPVRVAVPVPPSGVINIVGVHDGGGGITIGAMSGDAPVALPIMSEGQTMGVPVAAP
jgi:hypothetical protein